MSLFGSLFSGVSGLTAQSQSMGMISDNVSNVNTVAYKGAVPQFSTLVTRAERSASFSPGGVRAGTLYEIADQGLIQNSDSPTDVAVDGSGFFVVNREPDGSGEELYTRAGNFRTDVLGNLRNAAGFYLQGWALDGDEEIANANQMEVVNVDLVRGSVGATTRAETGINLDATQAAFGGAYAAGDMATFNSSDGVNGIQPHFTRAVDVVDSLGRTHATTLAFLKDAAANTWNVEVYGETGELETADHPDGLLASGQVAFDGDGTLASNTLTPVHPGGGAAGDPVGINWLDSDGAEDSSVDFGLGTIGQADGLTQFDADYSVAFVNQNGVEFGELTGVSIDEEGFVIASFRNGREQRVYQLPVATFANPLGLDPRSGNVYAETQASGSVNLREAGRSGAGSISPSALETANVDVADEFTKMIVTQRAYSANARVITTTDEMLDELVRATG